VRNPNTNLFNTGMNQESLPWCFWQIWQQNYSRQAHKDCVS